MQTRNVYHIAFWFPKNKTGKARLLIILLRDISWYILLWYRYKNILYFINKINSLDSQELIMESCRKLNKSTLLRIVFSLINHANNRTGATAKRYRVLPVSNTVISRALFLTEHLMNHGNHTWVYFVVLSVL